MSYVPINSLPSESRLWIYPSSTELSASQQDALGAALQEALAAWNAHGASVQWGFGFVQDRFLLVAINEDAAALTGCSIDQATRAMSVLEQTHNLSLTDSHRVFFRGKDGIRVVPRPEFAQLVERGEVTLDTVVFDTVVPTLGGFLSGSWECPARDSWHADAFPFGIAT